MSLSTSQTSANPITPRSPEEIFGIRYWPLGNDEIRENRVRSGCKPPIHLLSVAGKLFSQHVSKASALKPNYHEPRRALLEFGHGATIPVSELAHGSIIAYDVEKLLPHKQFSKIYPERITGPKPSNSALHWVNSPTSDLIMNPLIRPPQRKNLWTPLGVIIVPNGGEGRKYREYVREIGMGMLLPGGDNHANPFRPELPLYPEDSQTLDAKWTSISQPLNSPVGFTQWTTPRIGSNSAQRLRGLWLYDDSAAEWSQLTLPRPASRLTKVLIAMSAATLFNQQINSDPTQNAYNKD